LPPYSRMCTGKRLCKKVSLATESQIESKDIGQFVRNCAQYAIFADYKSLFERVHHFSTGIFSALQRRHNYATVWGSFGGIDLLRDRARDPPISGIPDRHTSRTWRPVPSPVAFSFSERLHRQNGLRPSVSRLYQNSLIMTHRDALPDLPARSGSRGDAAHHKRLRTPSGSPERAPSGSRFQPARGVANARRWVSIAFASAPAERAGNTITMRHYQ
jgi:hypothetical protein